MINVSLRSPPRVYHFSLLSAATLGRKTKKKKILASKISRMKIKGYHIPQMLIHQTQSGSYGGWDLDPKPSSYRRRPPAKPFLHIERTVLYIVPTLLLFGPQQLFSQYTSHHRPEYDSPYHHQNACQNTSRNLDRLAIKGTPDLISCSHQRGIGKHKREKGHLEADLGLVFRPDVLPE